MSSARSRAAEGRRRSDRGLGYSGVLGLEPGVGIPLPYISPPIPYYISIHPVVFRPAYDIFHLIYISYRIILPSRIVLSIGNILGIFVIYQGMHHLHTRYHGDIWNNAHDTYMTRYVNVQSLVMFYWGVHITIIYHPRFLLYKAIV